MTKEQRTLCDYLTEQKLDLCRQVIGLTDRINELNGWIGELCSDDHAAEIDLDKAYAEEFARRRAELFEAAGAAEAEVGLMPTAENWAALDDARRDVAEFDALGIEEFDRVRRTNEMATWNRV